MMKKIVFALCALFTLPANAQVGGVYAPASGGSGVSSISTTCGASGPYTGAVTLNGGVAINAQTGAYTVLATDCGKLLTFTSSSAITVTLPQAGTSGFLSGFYLAGVLNLGTGIVTIQPTTSTLNGQASVALAPGASIGVVSDGSNYEGATGAAAAPQVGAPVGAKRYYPLANGSPSTAGTIVAAQIYCQPFWIQQPQTWDSLHIYVSTSASSNVQMAIYGSIWSTVSTYQGYQPNGAPIVSSGNLADTVGIVTFTPATPVSLAQGVYFACEQAASATTKYYVFNNASSSGTQFGVQGTTAVGAIQSAGTDTSGGVSIASGGFGTWPTFSTASAFAFPNSTLIPQFAAHTYSVP